MVEEFLQAANCPHYTRNAWLYLRKELEEEKTTKGTMPNTAQEEILKRLISIQKRLSGSPLTLHKPQLYTDSARYATPAAI